MNRLALSVALLAAGTVSAFDPPSVAFASGKAIPKGGRVDVTDGGKPGPGQKDHRAVVAVSDFNLVSALPHAGPFDIYYTPKGGRPVLAVSRWVPKAGVQTVSLGDHLGTVFVRGDDLPRAAAVVVTATTDPGPGEKGHVAIQTAGDYKDDMAVPPGTYAVWVVPFNGARAIKVTDNVRVLAGREAKVPE